MSRTKYTKEMLEAAAKNASSISGVIRALGSTSYTGGTISHIKKRLISAGIDITHFLGRSHRRGLIGKRKTAQEVLVAGKTRRTKTDLLRRSLFDLGVPHECKVCGQPPVWNGKPLVLQIDHINGDWSDDRLENLRFICPPCHTQQPTYGFKSREPVESVKCGGCGVTLRSQATLDKHQCPRERPCKEPKAPKKVKEQKAAKGLHIRPEKADWPSLQELRELVWAQPVEKLAAALGVSGVAVNKRCKRLGIRTPPRGYWAKLKSNESVTWPSNEDLSKLVWTAPLREVAETLGTTANVVRLRCKRLGIPAPSKGHWNSHRVK